MDFYSNKFSLSEVKARELTVNELKSSNFQPYKSIINYIKELYSDRVKRLEASLSNLKTWESIDPALQIMKENHVIEHFLSARSDEIFNLCLKNETEKTIESLQFELSKKQFEIFRLEQIVFESKHGVYEASRGKYLTDSLRENFRDLWEKERLKNEKLAEEIEEKNNEINELKLYCDNLRQDAERMNWQRDNEKGQNNMRDARSEIELKEKYKGKMSLFKKKILEQRDLIENLQLQVKNRVNDWKSEKHSLKSNENYISKQEYESKIQELKEYYEKIMENKLKEIHNELNPDLRVVSEEKFYEVCREKINLERKLTNSLSPRSPNLNSHGQEKNRNNEFNENEIINIREKLKLSENRCSLLEEQNNNLLIKFKSLQDRTHSYKTTQNPIKPKLKNLENLSFLFKTQLDSIKAQHVQLLSLLKSETRRIYSDILNFFSSSKINFIDIQNKDLKNKLKSNSEAFDKLQEEVKSAKQIWKIKFRTKIDKVIKELKNKYEIELNEKINECNQLKMRLDKSYGDMNVSGYMIKQLKKEISQLRSEREEIRKRF